MRLEATKDSRRPVFFWTRQCRLLSLIYAGFSVEGGQSGVKPIITSYDSIFCWPIACKAVDVQCLGFMPSLWGRIVSL